MSARVLISDDERAMMRARAETVRDREAANDLEAILASDVLRALASDEARERAFHKLVIRTAPRRADTSEFAAFWTAYPRKTVKRDALKAWSKIEKPDELLPVILAALAWQRELWTDPKFIPYPSTWLNGRRWEDERPAPTPSAAPGPAAPVRSARLAPSAGWGEWAPPQACGHIPTCQTERSCRMRRELNARQGLPLTHGWTK